MLNLVLVIHCHQPVGNFHNVFEMAVEKCYRPILSLLKAHPSVKVGMHFSGPLLEWLNEHQTGIIDILSVLIARGQVEPLSGGFFEPLLASIPVRDARGQVQMMNEYIIRHFNREPTGFWLTERVWDPCLPLTLADTGMRYTVVDDTHFYYAGLKSDEIYGCYITEKEGESLRLLATPMIMRYLIPFKPVEEVLQHLRGLYEAGREMVVYGDDGEKFGLWPGTHEWVIKKGWLEKFFTAIEENSGWLRTVPPGDFVVETSPLGRIYLPQASYQEMSEWALPPEQGKALEHIVASLKEEGRWEQWRPFVRGGIWDNFLVKYDEANRMHKKMIFLSKMIGQDEEARAYLWRGQCNCAYWHGIFGGLYLGHLRRAVHQNLILAQRSMGRESGRGFCVLKQDIDKDGVEEILLWTPCLSLGLDPGDGGVIFELCHLSRALNISDTLTRRRETYHGHLNSQRRIEGGQNEGVVSIHDVVQAGVEDLHRSLVFDSYTRASLIDHFIGPETTPEGYAANDFTELGDFVLGRYEVKEAKAYPGEALVELSRAGLVRSKAVSVRKSVKTGKQASVTVDYEFECGASEPLSAVYGCEFNLTLYSDRDRGRYYFAPESGRRREASETGSEENLRRFELVNQPDRLTVAFTFSSMVSAWFFPLMTVSKSEEGFERTYQGSSLLFLYPLNLVQGQKAHFQIEMELLET